MLTACTHPRIAWVCKGVAPLLTAFVVLTVGSPPSGYAYPNSTTVLAGSAQSDPEAMEAMKGVLRKSGGPATWANITSVQESFSVSSSGTSTPETHMLVDDWSTGSPRYRRQTRGRTAPSQDHNGDAFFTAELAGMQTKVPELDQARVLVSRLPAAAADTILRRPEYVIQLTDRRNCQSGTICIDVFRSFGGPLGPIPEERWTISASTGLPLEVIIQMPNVGKTWKPAWKSVHFQDYTSEEGALVPSVILMQGVRGEARTWTLTSFKKNIGFDPVRFDQEVGR